MRIRARRSWRAAAPRSGHLRFVAPATATYIHHSVTTAPSPDATVAQEKAVMRQLQGIAFGRGFADISYSFVVFPSGRAYEGRGWKVVGAHTQGSNSTSHAIVFVGNFETARPTPKALLSAARIHKRGVRRGYISKSATIKGHREAPGAATACPGAHLFGKLHEIRALAR